MNALVQRRHYRMGCGETLNTELQCMQYTTRSKESKSKSTVDTARTHYMKQKRK